MTIVRHADHGPDVICRPAFGYGLCEPLEPVEGDCQHGCNGDCVEYGSDRCDFTCHPAAYTRE